MELYESFNVVVPILNPLVITTANPLPNASLNSPYSLQMMAANGVPSYSWSLLGVQSGTFAGVLSAALSGESIGYGSGFGTLSPATDINGNTISALYQSTSTQNIILTIPSGASLGQSYFANLVLTGPNGGTLPSGGATFTYSGGVNQWQWFGPAPYGIFLQANNSYGAVYKTATIKWNPGHYMASNNLNGSPSAYGGNGRNAAEITALGSSGSSVLGYQAIYTWDNGMDLGPLSFTANVGGATSGTLTAAITQWTYTVRFPDGNYRQVTVGNGSGSGTSTACTWSGALSGATMTSGDFYLFNMIVADYGSLPAGKRFSVMIWGERFSGTGYSGLGIPAYILNSSTYGAGMDGIHYGYWGLDFGSGQSGASCAWWRSAVQGRAAKLFDALAHTPSGSGSYTFDTDPMVEDVFWQESSLSLSSGSDYSDSAFAAQCESLQGNMQTSLQNTNRACQVNYTATQATVNGIVAQCVTNQGILSGPDVYPFIGTSPTSYATWGQLVYIGYQWNGSAWVTGGTDYRTQMGYIGMAQQATYTKAQNFGSTNVVDILTSANVLQAGKMYWTYLASDSYAGWTTNVLPMINANALTHTGYPANYP